MSIWVWEPKCPSITEWLGLHRPAPAALKSSRRFYQVVSWLSSPHLSHTCEQTKPCRGHDEVNFDCNWRRVYCKAAFYGIPMHRPELNCQLSFRLFCILEMWNCNWKAGSDAFMNCSKLQCFLTTCLANKITNIRFQSLQILLTNCLLSGAYVQDLLSCKDLCPSLGRPASPTLPCEDSKSFSRREKYFVEISTHYCIVLVIEW